MQTVNKLNTLTKKVEYCLERFTETRNSDIDLFTRLCESFFPPFERPLYSWRDLASAMHRVPNLDHIARARRKVIEINGYKKYLPTDKSIAMARGLNEAVWIDYAKQNNIPLDQIQVTPLLKPDDENHISNKAVSWL